MNLLIFVAFWTLLTGVYASLVDKFSRLCKFSRFTSLVDDTTLVDFNFTSLVDRQV